MKWTLTRGEDKKDYICNKFDKAKNSEERNMILKAVQTAKSQNNRTNNQRSKDDNTSTDKNEAKTTTGSKPAPESKTEVENTPTQNE